MDFWLSFQDLGKQGKQEDLKLPFYMAVMWTVPWVTHASAGICTWIWGLPIHGERYMLCRLVNICRIMSFIKTVKQH